MWIIYCENVKEKIFLSYLRVLIRFEYCCSFQDWNRASVSMEVLVEIPVNRLSAPVQHSTMELSANHVNKLFLFVSVTS